MKKIIPFTERKIKFIDRNAGGDFAERWHLAPNSAGVVDIITYQGTLTVEISNYDRNINWAIKDALSCAVNHCYSCDDYENNVKSLLKSTGVEVLDIHVENAVQEMYEIPNKGLGENNILRGEKESLITDNNLDSQPTFNK